MLGWTTLIALKWLDNTNVKIYRAKNRPSCNHTTNNCRCVHDYYKSGTGSRPFATTFTPPKENDVFLPSSPELRLQLTKVGILVSSVICADQKSETKLPKALTNYRISTMRNSDGLRPSSFSLLRRAGRALRALLGTSGPILSSSIQKYTYNICRSK